MCERQRGRGRYSSNGGGVAVDDQVWCLFVHRGCLGNPALGTGSDVRQERHVTSHGRLCPKRPETTSAHRRRPVGHMLNSMASEMGPGPKWSGEIAILPESRCSW